LTFPDDKCLEQDVQHRFPFQFSPFLVYHVRQYVDPFEFDFQASQFCFWLFSLLTPRRNAVISGSFSNFHWSPFGRSGNWSLFR
jgi:hypothetical protein